MIDDNDKIPLPSEESKERAWQAARIAFNQSQKFESQSPTIEKGFLNNFKWVLAGAALALLAILVFNRPRQADDVEARLSTLASSDDIKYLKNVRSLFPKNLKSIESTDGGEYQLVLSQGVQTESILPLVVEVQAGQKKKKVITFSGQTINVPKPDGTTENVEVYFNGQGEILLIGPTILWRSNLEGKDTDANSIFQIKAEALPEPKDTI